MMASLHQTTRSGTRPKFTVCGVPGSCSNSQPQDDHFEFDKLEIGHACAEDAKVRSCQQCSLYRTKRKRISKSFVRLCSRIIRYYIGYKLGCAQKCERG